MPVFLFQTPYIKTSVLGLFLPFAQSGRALVFAALIALLFGHWISIGSVVNFTPSHLPRQHLMRSRFAEQNNCSWAPPIAKIGGQRDEGYTSHLNPVGRGPPASQIKEDYPSHIPVVKTKTEDTQSVCTTLGQRPNFLSKNSLDFDHSKM